MYNAGLIDHVFYIFKRFPFFHLTHTFKVTSGKLPPFLLK